MKTKEGAAMKYSSVILWVSLAVSYTGLAQATDAPYYAYGSIVTSHGSPDYSLIEAADQARAGAVSVAGGSKWWCDVPNCGVSVSAGASVAYAEVNADPATGTLGARAGSLGYSAYGGYGKAYGYISQVFRVGTDGSLQTGDSVTVDLNMLLEGSIDSQTSYGNLAGLVTLNYYDPAQQYSDNSGPVSYMPVTTFEDNLYTQPYLDSLLAHVKSVNNQTGTLNTVNFQGSATANVQVGDILTLEGMILATNSLGYSDGLGYSWTDALNTMTPSLTTETAGAVLSPYQPAVVPAPAAVWLFGLGLLGLIGIARRGK
jgi:hypothetical protein